MKDRMGLGDFTCGVWSDCSVSFGLNFSPGWPRVHALTGNAGLVADMFVRFVTGSIVIPGWRIFSVAHRKQTLCMRCQPV